MAKPNYDITDVEYRFMARKFVSKLQLMRLEYEDKEIDDLPHMTTDEAIAYLGITRDDFREVINHVVALGHDNIAFDNEGYYFGGPGDTGRMLAHMYRVSMGLQERYLRLLEVCQKYAPDKMEGMIEKFESGTEMKIEQLLDGKSNKQLTAMRKKIKVELLESGE